MSLPARPPPPQLDAGTLKYIVMLLRERMAAVQTYGAGGCPTCHDAELRGAIAKLEGLVTGPPKPPG